MRGMRASLRKLSLLVLLLVPALLSAQFYNGMQMKFGKNRVQFNNRYWKYYRFERFDVYSYENGTDLSLYVADFVEKELQLIERFFDYEIERRIIFLVYNKMSDFRQSNIGLTSEEEAYNIGGTTQIIQNKVFLYFEGDHVKFERQIRAAIAEVLLTEMMFGNGIRDNLTNSTMINLPGWYLDGLISFVSNPWDYEIENWVKDGIVSGKYRKFVNLQDDDARYAGHAFWKYVADLYGASIIPQILYITKINKNAESGFLYVLGSKLKDLSFDWTAYYLGVYTSREETGELPEEGRILKKPKKRWIYQNIRISPDGENVSFVTNQKGKYKIWIYNELSGKKKRIYKRGQKLDQINDYSFPVTAWHPTSEILGFVTEEKGFLKIHFYNLESREITTRNLFFFEKILDMQFSPDARKLVLSAVADGQTDIWVFDIASSTTERITNDLADDYNPRFMNYMNNISFVSNRRSDTLYLEENDPENNTTTAFAVYVYDYARKSRSLQKISEGDYINHYQPLSPGRNEFFYLSDKNGIINRYYAKYDSTISLVDTIIHYRYFANSFPLTNYNRNILSQDINTETNEIAEIIYSDRRYHMFKYPEEFERRYGDRLEPTEYRDRHVNRLKGEDSIYHVEKKVISMKDIADNRLVVDGDTISLQEFRIDINNYIFEREKLTYYNNQLRSRNLNLVLDSVQNNRQMYIDYTTAFYPNMLVNQIDFSFLNASYQAFTGGAFYFNPGLNLLFKVGANDLFEDYRLVGGVRLATDFDSNEYLLSFENLKKQLDKQLLFHRQVFKNYTSDGSFIKTYTHELLASLKYPLNQTMAVKGTASFRHDNTVYLSTDIKNLDKPSIVKVWGGIKGELIFDNTRVLGTNLYSGMRYKVFAEAYRQINTSNSDLYVIGADFRHYLRIHRTLIWANRFAASTSFGRSPLIYYLGSVDNWINLFQQRTPTFNESVDIDYTRNYAYQALATNLRGFSQNIRNGNNFAVINTELRWPILRYLAGHPLSSGFLNNFQVVGFADVGSAWTGLHPFTDQNAWDREVITNGPITITLDANRDPIVAGYGVGARAQLMGYFVRLDWAWGVENGEVQPRMFYLSLSLDF